MGINISIKNVPAEKVDCLKLRAKRNHRSLQGELLAIIDEAIHDDHANVKGPFLTLDQIAEEVRKIGLTTGDDSTRWIRQDRDRR